MGCVYPAILILALLQLTLPLFLDNDAASPNDYVKECASGPMIAESIPIGVEFVPEIATHVAWLDMFERAQHSIDIAAFYFSLTDGVHLPGGAYGIDVYNGLVAAAKRGVSIRVVANIPTPVYPQVDVFSLMAAGVIDAVFINFTELDPALTGILHTKFILADQTDFYVGSANMDWRSLSQVKELGLYFRNCAPAAVDINKVFSVYWLAASTRALPASWPPALSAQYNQAQPDVVLMSGVNTSLYFSMSPPFLRPPRWTPDEDAITHAIKSASTIVRFSVMDYLPGVMYDPPIEYWDTIDKAIRTVQFNTTVKFQILIGYWTYSFPQQWSYLSSLNQLENVEVRYFIVPPVEPPIPYTRVNHAKWMITDNIFYVTTSNWVGDYFVNTAGVGTSIWNNAKLLANATAVFDRDWSSSYSIPLPSAPGTPLV